MLIMASHLPNPIWYIFGSLIAAGGLYALIRYLKKEPPSPHKTDYLIPHGVGQDPVHTVHTPVTPDVDAKETDDDFVDNKEIAAELTSIIHFFKGFMNSLLDISRGLDYDDANITFENLSQVIAGHGSSMLKKWFFDFEKDRKDWNEAIYMDKARQILKLFRICGITPGTETKTRWNEDAEKHYKRIGRIEQGEIVEVVAPCWIYKNTLFEQGIVKSNINLN